MSVEHFSQLYDKKSKLKKSLDQNVKTKMSKTQESKNEKKFLQFAIFRRLVFFFFLTFLMSVNSPLFLMRILYTNKYFNLDRIGYLG